MINDKKLCREKKNQVMAAAKLHHTFCEGIITESITNMRSYTKMALHTCTQ